MSALEERYKTCGRCMYNEESRDIKGSTCYLCRKNPKDNRIDWFEEKSKYVPCKVCGGRGWVQIAPGVRGIKICDFCHGKDEVRIQESTKGGERMIKLEGRILLFDQVNLNQNIFPKFCKIDIPEKVPLLWNFNHGQVIGMAEVLRDDIGLVARAELFPADFIGIDDVTSIFTDGKIGVGGFYNRIKKHEDNGLIIVDECSLRLVSMTLEPVHEEYYLKIVEEKENE